MSLGRWLGASLPPVGSPLVVALALAVVACSAAPVPSDSPVALTFDAVEWSAPRSLPLSGPGTGALMPTPDAAFGWVPTSDPIEHGVGYRFTLGHCGLHSPVDVDGSFWDAIEGFDATGAPLDLGRNEEMINATPGVIVVIGDEARFRTESGILVRFERHRGDKAFAACM